MRDDITLLRRLPLAGRIHKMIDNVKYWIYSEFHYILVSIVKTTMQQ